MIYFYQRNDTNLTNQKRTKFAYGGMGRFYVCIYNHGRKILKCSRK